MATLNPFFRCPKCSRIHVGTFVGNRTVCHCGFRLRDAAWKTNIINPGIRDFR